METTDNGGTLQEYDEEIVPDHEEHIQRLDESSYRSVFTSVSVYTRARIRRKIRKIAQIRINFQGPTSLVEIDYIFLEDDADTTT